MYIYMTVQIYKENGCKHAIEKKKVFQKDVSAENTNISCATMQFLSYLRRKYFNKLRNYGIFYTFAQKISLIWIKSLLEEMLNTRYLQIISPQKGRNLLLFTVAEGSGKLFSFGKPPMTASPFSWQEHIKFPKTSNSSTSPLLFRNISKPNGLKFQKIGY